MDMQNVTTPEVNQEAPKSKLGLFALIGVVLVTAIAGGVYYFGLKEAPPALPSQGGLQGSISNQATGFYEYTAADVTAHKAGTGTKEKISPKRGVAYPYITEDATMGALLTKDTVPVKGTAVMYGYWDNSVSKWITTQQTVKAWAAVTTPLSGTGLTTGKGVLKAGRALALITNVASLDAYKLADSSVEPSATLAKAAVDSLAEGWHLVALDKTEFDRVKKSFNYSSLWMLNADGNFVEVPATFDSKDLKNFVFWLKFNFKPAADAPKVADVTTGTMAWNDAGDLTVPWTKVDGATTYNVTVGAGTYVVSADGKVTLGGVAVDDKVATSAKTATGYTLTVKKSTAVDSAKPIDVKVEALKGAEVIATTGAKTVPAEAAKAETGTVVDIKGADGFVVEATPADSAVSLRPDFDQSSISEEDKEKVFAAFKGVSIAYKNETDKLVTLPYDHSKKVFTSPVAYITIIDNNNFKVSGLTNDTEYTFIVTALYEGYKSTPVTVKATPAKVAADTDTDTTTPAALKTESNWGETGLLVAWREVKDATTYVVTVDGSATYTVKADGTTTADSHAMTSTKDEAGTGTTFTVTLLGLDSTKAHTVKVEALKGTEVVAETSADEAKVPAKKAAEANTIVKVEDALIVEKVTPADKSLVITFTKLEGGANNTGLQVSYYIDAGAGQTEKPIVLTVNLNEDNGFKETNVELVEENVIKISNLNNDTKYNILLELTYGDGFTSKTGVVKDTGTPKTTDASLNYGFASIFDDVLNSLFNLFR